VQALQQGTASTETTNQLAHSQEAQKVYHFKQLLADPEIQSWLQSSLTDKNKTAANISSEGLRDSFSQLVVQIRQRKQNLLIAWAQLESAPIVLMDSWRAQMTKTQSLSAVTYILIFLFVGAGFEWLYAQYTGAKLLRLELQKPENLKRKVITGTQRALITFAGLGFFALGSIGVFLSFDWPPLIAYLVMEILVVILVFRVATTIIRFFLAPRLKELRLAPFNNTQAKSIYLWTSILILLSTLNTAIANVFDKILAGSSNSLLTHSALSVNLANNLIVLLVSLAALYFVSSHFSHTLANDDGQFKRSKTNKFWTGYLAIIGVLTYLLWMLNLDVLMQTLIVLGFLIPTTHLFRAWLDYLFDQGEIRYQEQFSDAEQINELSDSDTDNPEEPPSNLSSPYDNYRPIARRLTRFVLIISAIAILMFIWGMNIFSLSDNPSLTGTLFKISIDVIAAVLIADLIWIWAKTIIDKRLADYRPPEDGHAPGPEARMATLLPLFRTMLIVTLISMVCFSVLASLGFNIGPLLAGAGVIGLAIGFGAQTLVKDVVSGIFYLIDDAFRVGEYIEIGNLRGTVESMSVRSLRIRHHRGAVHTVPFGELKSITNHSRDWVIMKLEFRIPFDTNMQQVKKLVKKIGKKLLENPDYGHSFIEPLKSQGVRRMEEFNMVLGVKFMTRPGEQWVIRREAYHKIRDTFEENGIHLAERNVKVEVLNTQPLDEKTRQAVVGAAQNAVDPQGPKPPIPDEP
jgi:small-conductance mechanosensitive channel